MIDEKPPNWLRVSLGKDTAPKPPALNSERVNDLVGRALLTPRDIQLAEIQEMAAAILNHLVETKG